MPTKFIKICFVLLMFAFEAESQNLRVLDSLFSLLERTKDENVKIIILKDLAWEFRSSNPAQAFSYAIDALSLAQEYKLNDELPSIYNYLGVIRRNQGNYTSALEYYFTALKRAEEQKNIGETAYALNNIGGIYSLQKNYQQALENVQRAIEKFETLNNVKGLAYAYVQIIYIYIDLKEFDKALFYLEKAFKIQKQRNDEVQMAVIYNIKGKIYGNQNLTDSAKYYYMLGLKLNEKNQNQNGVIVAHNDLAAFFEANKQYKDAINHYTLALNMGIELDVYRRICTSLDGLSRAYAGLKQFDKAYMYHVRFKNLIDSIVNEESEKKVTQLEMQYQFDKQLKIKEFEAQQKTLIQERKLKQMTINRNLYLFLTIFILIIAGGFFYAYRLNRQTNIRLEEKRKEIEKQRDELQLVNATKDKFFSIIAHDLKNPFTSIIGFSELVLKQYNRFDKDQILDFMQSINTTARYTHKLLENLLEWARTQTGNIEFAPEVIDFSIIAKENILLQKETAKKKKINLYLDIKENMFVFIDKNMIDTALRNFTANAIKFTNPEGEVKISAKDCGGFVEVCVTDNGVGIKDDDLPKLFKIDKFHSTRGTNHEAGTGLGLVICKEFIERNGGRILVESKSGEGTKVSFTLPKPETMLN